MTRIRLSDGRLTAEVSTASGAILRFAADRPNGPLPLLRPFGGSFLTDPRDAGCFPLVPFGNRIRDNAFSFEGASCQLSPNTAEPLYLHGDGWLGLWRETMLAPNVVELSFSRSTGPGSPYVYRARQVVTLGEGGLGVALSVTNLGPRALPFGLGLHPFFPRTPETTIWAPASDYWGEGADYLPTGRLPLPEDLDFRSPRPVPDRWVNNSFEGWSGKARIVWPEANAALDINADPIFGRYVVYVPDIARDPAYRRDFFCLEPMSHAVDAHRQPDGGGLVRLAPGETLTGVIRLTPDLG